MNRWGTFLLSLILNTAEASEICGPAHLKLFYVSSVSGLLPDNIPTDFCQLSTLVSYLMELSERTGADTARLLIEAYRKHSPASPTPSQLAALAEHFRYAALLPTLPVLRTFHELLTEEQRIVSDILWEKHGLERIAEFTDAEMAEASF